MLQMKSIVTLCLLVATSSGAWAQAPRVIRKPVMEFAPSKSDAADRKIFKAALSADGKLVACTHLDGKLAVYSIVGAKLLFTAEPLKSRSGLAHSHDTAFSPDGKLVAFSRKEKQIEILDALTGKPHSLCELPGNRPDDVDALAFSPDGKKLAVSSGVLYHKNLHIFDAATGKLLGQPLNDVDGIAYQLIFSADGKRLVANHWQTIYVVDAVNHRLTDKVTAQVATVFFRGDQLCAVHEESSAIHEVTGKSLGKTPIGRFIEKIDSPSGMRMAIAGAPPVNAIPQKSEVTVRNMEGRELFRVIGEDSPIRRVCLSADARTLLVLRDSLRVEVFRLE
jgi:hypothetical protein